MALEVNQQSEALTRNEVGFFFPLSCLIQTIFFRYFSYLYFCSSSVINSSACCPLTSQLTITYKLHFILHQPCPLKPSSVWIREQLTAFRLVPALSTAMWTCSLFCPQFSAMLIWLCGSSPDIPAVLFSAREYNWQSPNVIYLKDFLTQKVISMYF